MGKINISPCISSNWEQLQKELNASVKTKKKKKETKRNRQQSNIQQNKWKLQKEEIESLVSNPSNSKTKIITKQKVLALDCEYVGTGFEGRDDMLARISIVDVTGSVIYDKYVKPTDEITDYRTEVSGIRPGHLERGEPKQQVQQEVYKMLAGNIVVGHGLNNDFKVLGFSHPAQHVRDTARYKPLREILQNKPRKTPSLKLLAHEILGVQIQQGEHDSITDARTALRIYQLHQNRWDQEVRSKAGRKKHK